MRSLEVFLPMKELRVPPGLPGVVDLEFVREADPFVFEADTDAMASSTAAILLTHKHVCVPTIHFEEDGSAATIHPTWVDRRSAKPETVTMPTSTQGMPVNFDGITLRNGENSMLLVGVAPKGGTDTNVLWGVSNFSVVDEAVEQVTSSILTVHDDEVFQYYMSAILPQRLLGSSPNRTAKP